MSWKTIFQNYQTPEIGKNGKLTSNILPQVSQFSHFPVSGETQKISNKHIHTLEKIEINLEKLKAFLGEDWDDYKNNPELLTLWSDLLFKNHLIEEGKTPDNFTAITNCKQCGYVYVPPELTNGGNVLGCPWCWNRVKKLPIPKPVSTH